MPLQSMSVNTDNRHRSAGTTISLNSHGVLYQVRGMRPFKHLDRNLDVTFLTQSRDRSMGPAARGLGHRGSKAESLWARVCAQSLQPYGAK